jgi:hypothetical protein
MSIFLMPTQGCGGASPLDRHKARGSAQGTIPTAARVVLFGFIVLLWFVSYSEQGSNEAEAKKDEYDDH